MFPKTEFLGLFAPQNKDQEAILKRLFDKIHGDPVCVGLLYNALLLGELSIHVSVQRVEESGSYWYKQ